MSRSFRKRGLEELPPITWLRNVRKEWPDVDRKASMFRKSKGDGLNWPDWCYLPIAAGYAIATAHEQEPENNLLGARWGALITAAMAWAYAKPVYTFDPDLYRELITQPFDDIVPVDAFIRLPFYCVYIETPGLSMYSLPCKGIWAHLECDANTGGSELRLVVFTHDASIFPIAVSIHLVEGMTISDGIDRFAQIAVANHEKLEGIIESPTDMEIQAAIELLKKEITPFINLILYLCSQHADIQRSEQRGRSKNRTAISPLNDQCAKWDVGIRVGSSIRKYENQLNSNEGERTSGDRSKPRPHIRRAHWHGYWVGSQDEKELIVKWIPPIPVNVDGSDELPAVVKPVE